MDKNNLKNNEMIKSRTEWFSNYLLRWDLEDLNEDITSLQNLSKNDFSISLSQRLRFYWRNKLPDQVKRYQELIDIANQKVPNIKILPTEIFFHPIKDIPQKISENDIKSQKLLIINDFISRYWQDAVFSYIQGFFPSTILLCTSSIELMIKAVILRDDEEFYEEIKGKSGFQIKKLMKRYQQQFKPIEQKLERIEKIRGNIIAHSSLIIEQMEKEEKLIDIINYHVDWHNKKPITVGGTKGYTIEVFKNLAREAIEITIEVLNHLTNTKLKV